MTRLTCFTIFCGPPRAFNRERWTVNPEPYILTPISWTLYREPNWVIEKIAQVEKKLYHVIVYLRCRGAIVLALCLGILSAFFVFPANLSVAGSPWDFQPGGIFVALLPAAQMAGNPGNRCSFGGLRRSWTVGRVRFLLPPGALVESGLVKWFFQSTAGSAGVVSSLSGFEFYDCVLGSRNPVCTPCKVIHFRLFPLWSRDDCFFFVFSWWN